MTVFATRVTLLRLLIVMEGKARQKCRKFQLIHPVLQPMYSTWSIVPVVWDCQRQTLCMRTSLFIVLVTLPQAHSANYLQLLPTHSPQCHMWRYSMWSEQLLSLPQVMTHNWIHPFNQKHCLLVQNLPTLFGFHSIENKNSVCISSEYSPCALKCLGKVPVGVQPNERFPYAANCQAPS